MRNPDWQAQGYMGAGVVIVHPDFPLVLGITRDLDMADLGFPGGGADPEDPTLEAAAARETFEETGVLIDPEILTYVDENPGRRGQLVTFFAPTVREWPHRFGSTPFEGYVGFYEPAAFVNPNAPYRDYNQRVLSKLGLL